MTAPLSKCPMAQLDGASSALDRALPVLQKVSLCENPSWTLHPASSSAWFSLRSPDHEFLHRK